MVSEPLVKDQYISTSAAAKLLGVSVGTVQQMVESGELTAWKTAGGHRRIDKSSVMQRQLLRTKGALAKESITGSSHGQEQHHKSPQPLQILVAEDDPVTIKIYQHIFAGFGNSIKTTFALDGIDALLQLGQQSIDLLILDLDIPYVDGYEMLNKIGGTVELQALGILVVTGTDIAQSKQKQDALMNITVLQKPVIKAFLEGYIQGALAMKNKSRIS